MESTQIKYNYAIILACDKIHTYGKKLICLSEMSFLLDDKKHLP